MFVYKLVASIVYSIVVVIPNAYDLSSVGLHLIVKWIIVLRQLIFALNVFSWQVSSSILHENSALLIGVRGITSPYPEVWRCRGNRFENVVTSILDAVT